MVVTTMTMTLMTFKQKADVIFVQAFSIVEGYNDKTVSCCSTPPAKLYQKMCTVLEGFPKTSATVRCCWL